MSTAIIPFPKRGSMGQTEPEDEMCSALGVQKFLYQNNMSPQKTENKTSDLLTSSNRSMRKQCQVKHPGHNFHAVFCISYSFKNSVHPSRIMSESTLGAIQLKALLKPSAPQLL